MKKTFQTNIAANDPYDTRLLDPHSLVSYRSFTAMLYWSVFLAHLRKCVFVIIIIYVHFTYIS